MEPTDIAAVTSALTFLGTKFLGGSISAAGKTSWNKLLGLLGWDATPEVAQLAEKVEQELAAHPEKMSAIVEELKQHGGEAGALVSHIHAKNVFTNTGNISGGTFNIT